MSTKLRTTIAGSLPKPSWLAEPEALWAAWKLDGDALAEAKRDAVRLVLRQAWWCLAIGLVLGVAIAFTSVNLIRSLLFQIAPTDLPTYVVALSCISAVALGAAVVPATRAARIDPLIVLRRGQT